MAVSPYLISITVILALVAGFIYFNLSSARKTVRIHDSSSVLPQMEGILPDVADIEFANTGFKVPETVPPFQLQPIVEEATEGFANMDETLPAPANPFMNVLIPEIKYNPERPEAAPVDDPLVKQQLDDMFRTNFFNDPTDVFGRSQDQRQFITMPSTSIPNDRESFMKWCYNIVPQNCKSGGREGCLPGTDGGPITSLNQAY